jgi:glucose-1-phosphate adenylyltransferase
MKKILALILAGGRVDELSVLTLFRPKSALPIGGLYRVIDFPLSNLMHAGIERVGILSQYRSDSLINHIGSGASWDMVGRDRGISILPPMKGNRSSDWYKGTADAVYQNMEFIDRYDPDYILILSGDHVYKMDYQDLIDFHESRQADVTISFVKVDGPGADRFGQGVIEEEDQRGGCLNRYVEKPSSLISPWASMTIYLFSRDALSFVMEEMMRPPATEHFGRDIFPVLLDKKKVCGYKFQGPWAYTRTIDEYWQANMNLLEEKPEIDLDGWQLRTNPDNERFRDRAPAIVGPEAQVQQSIIQNGCLIEGVVKNSILFPGAKVKRNSVVENSILMFDTVIEAGAKLDKIITDVEVTIGQDAKVGIGKLGGTNMEYPDLLSSGITVIGRNTCIPANISIGRNCIIYPNKKESYFSSVKIPSGRTLK